MQKQTLIESFQGFCSSTVEPRHLELARACIQAGENNYECLPFQQLLEWNRVRVDKDGGGGGGVCVWGGGEGGG